MWVEQLGRLERLHRFNALLLDRTSATGIARAIVEEGRDAVYASAAAVAVPAADGSPLVLASHGYSTDLLSNDAAIYRGPTPLVDVLSGGEALWIESSEQLRHEYSGLVEHANPLHASWAALPLDANSRRVGALVLSFERPGPFSDEDRSFMTMVAQHCAQALERARLGELAMRARVNAEFAERRLSFLAEVSARLAASLDYRHTLASVASVAVPEIADWCLVHLLDDDRQLRLIAAGHPDPLLVEQVLAMDVRIPMSDAGPAARVLATDQPQFSPALDSSGQLRDATPDSAPGGSDDNAPESVSSVLAGFGVSAQLSVPVRVDGRVCGVLTFANAESGRRFSEFDLTFAVELGLRAGQAVQNSRLYEAAHRASEAKSDFLAVMSHELRTPLNAIIGYSDLIMMGVPEPVSDGALRHAQRIRTASSSLLRIVEEILSFSRMEAGKEDIRISPVDLIATIQECISLVEPLAEEKELPLTLDTSDNVLRVVSDEGKIKQILTNLLSNAVKFTQRGSITVRTRRSATEVCIDVIDSGIGIPDEHHERIFEAFWQVEQSATRRFGGTGLGLGVARRLARLLEGRLEVTSAVDQGSTFTLVLPLHTPGVSRLS